MIPSLEGWPTKAKEAPSPHEVKLAPLDTNPVFQNLGGGPGSNSIKKSYIVEIKEALIREVIVVIQEEEEKTEEIEDERSFG